MFKDLTSFSRVYPTLPVTNFETGWDDFITEIDDENKCIKDGSYFTSVNSEFKAISLWQPWASLIRLSIKCYETRSWKTNYRGKLLICSTVGHTKEYKEYLKIKDELQLPPWDAFPHGYAIAICDLVNCIQITQAFIQQQSRTELLCGDWQVGHYAWELSNVRPLVEPFAVKGKQGLFSVTVTNFQPIELFLEENEFFSREKVLEEKQLFSLEKIEQPSRRLETSSIREVVSSASGSLYQYLKNIKLKSSEITSYPRISGEREVSNLNHWYWGYNYKIKQSNSWKTKSLSVPRRKVDIVRQMIEGNAPCSEIRAFLRVLEDGSNISREKVLEEKQPFSLEKNQASGSLYQYFKNKKLKSGMVASYPCVDGIRDPNQPKHWYWGYSYEVFKDGRWVGRTLSVPQDKVVVVRAMIDSHKSVSQIKAFIQGKK